MASVEVATVSAETSSTVGVDIVPEDMTSTGVVAVSVETPFVVDVDICSEEITSAGLVHILRTNVDIRSR
jgi:hypothetical protein